MVTFSDTDIDTFVELDQRICPICKLPNIESESYKFSPTESWIIKVCPECKTKWQIIFNTITLKRIDNVER